MSPGTAEKARKVSLDFVIAVMQKAIAGIVATTTIIAFLWTFARNEVQDYSREFVGTNEVIEKTEQVATVVAEQGAQLEGLKVQVAALVPPPEIVEYDALRSYLIGPCFAGDECRGQLRARRTEFGKACSAPTMQGRWFVDAVGRRFAADRSDDHRPSRLQDEWVVIPVDFIVPPLAQSGLGEFYMELSYDCLMDTDGDAATAQVKVPIMRRTLALTVEIEK